LSIWNTKELYKVPLRQILHIQGDSRRAGLIKNSQSNKKQSSLDILQNKWQHLTFICFTVKETFDYSKLLKHQKTEPRSWKMKSQIQSHYSNIHSYHWHKYNVKLLLKSFNYSQESLCRYRLYLEITVGRTIRDIRWKHIRILISGLIPIYKIYTPSTQ